MLVGIDQYSLLFEGNRMMDSWKQYFVSLLVCSLSCAVISQLISDKDKKALLRPVFGILLAIVILNPLHTIKWEAFFTVPELSGNAAADCYISEGEKAAMTARRRCIKDACEEYILDKAEALGAELTVDVSLNEELIPAFSVITGASDSAVQRELERILSADLGIPKENQQWIG